MTLTEFLLARIAEDEAVARGDESRAREWSLGGGYPQTILSVGNALLMAETFHDPDSVNWPGEHIVRHDPARVLAECDAKRRIVELYELRNEQGVGNLAISAHATGLGLAIRALALPYAAHPDYREEWRP